jgi:hypothetical protein
MFGLFGLILLGLFFRPKSGHLFRIGKAFASTPNLTYVNRPNLGLQKSPTYDYWCWQLATGIR